MATKAKTTAVKKSTKSSPKLSAAKQAAAKQTAAKARRERNNPTLHGLLIARTLSGTVVRTLLFLVLSAALVLVATLNLEAGDNVGAMSMLILFTAVYLLFDVLYVLMANIRPLHPRLDRIVLPVSLGISLITLYAPLVIVTNASSVIGIWITGGIALLFILGVRFGLLIASSK